MYEQDFIIDALFTESNCTEIVFVFNYTSKVLCHLLIDNRITLSSSF